MGPGPGPGSRSPPSSPASSPRATRVLTQLAHFEDLTQHLGQLDATAAEGTFVLVFSAAVLQHNLQAGRGRSQRAGLCLSRATATSSPNQAPGPGHSVLSACSQHTLRSLKPTQVPHLPKPAAPWERMLCCWLSLTEMPKRELLLLLIVAQGYFFHCVVFSKSGRVGGRKREREECQCERDTKNGCLMHMP